MKKVLCVVLVVVFSLSLITISAMACPACEAATASNDEIRVLLNGEELNFDVPPQIIGNRTMVPMRAIFEALGFEVTWEDNFDSVEFMVTATIDFFAEDDEQFDWVIDSPLIVAETNLNGITLQIGSYFMLFGSHFGLSWIELDVPPQIVDNRTLVPIRAISEATGADVDWCGDSRTVIITTEVEVEEQPEMPSTTTYVALNIDGQLVLISDAWRIDMPAGWQEMVNEPGHHSLMNADTLDTIYVSILGLEGVQLVLSDYVESTLQDRLAAAPPGWSISVFEEITTERINDMDFYTFATLREVEIMGESLRLYFFHYFVIHNNMLFEFANGRMLENEPLLEFTEMVMSFNPIR